MSASLERPWARCAVRALALFVLILAAPPHAWASLGGGLTSIEEDQAQMQGSRSVVLAQDYAVHEIQAPTGTIVREFLLANGTVFAVTWRGPFIPNLRQLLGVHFNAFASAQDSPRAHRPLGGVRLMQSPGLVVELGGHMRAFYGRAYIPQLLPLGIQEGLR